MWIIKNIVKQVNIYLDKYNVKDKSWYEIMSNKNIPQEVKNYINGSRYVYIEELINKLMNNQYNFLINLTGKKNITSDKDIQIMFNINKYNSKKFNFIINNCIEILKEGNKIWETNNIDYLLDINLYPPTIINFITGKIKNKKYILKSIHKINNRFTCIIIPQLYDKITIEKFYINELTNLKKKKNKDLNKYYDNYKLNIAENYNNIINCYTNTKKVSDIEFNNYLNNLIEFNNIGSEMYLTISSIIIVVWNTQMKNKIPNQLLKVLAPISYLENKELYKLTKKQKYKERYDYCKKYMH